MAPGTELAEPKDVRELITERIRAMMMDLMSEEEFRKIVDKEMDWFVNDRTTESGGYGKRYVPSPLKAIIRTTLDEIAKERLKELLGTPEYQVKWMIDEETGAGNHQLAPALQEIVEKLLPSLWKEALGGLVQNVVQHIQSGLQSR